MPKQKNGMSIQEERDSGCTLEKLTLLNSADKYAIPKRRLAAKKKFALQLISSSIEFIAKQRLCLANSKSQANRPTYMIKLTYTADEAGCDRDIAVKMKKILSNGQNQYSTWTKTTFLSIFFHSCSNSMGDPSNYRCPVWEGSATCFIKNSREIHMVFHTQQTIHQTSDPMLTYYTDPKTTHYELDVCNETP